LLATRSLSARIHRVARTPVWGWPDWAFAGEDRTFGNRFDDPDGLYRVLYASSTRYGCYLETLARFRPDLHVYAELRDIGGEDDFMPPGVIPLSWLSDRRLGAASVTGDFADIGASSSLGYLRTQLAAEILAHGFGDFDASVLYVTAPRSFTQLVSRIVFGARLSGIRYLSKYGNDVENYGIFEGSHRLVAEDEVPIDVADPELEAALVVHNLRFEGVRDSIEGVADHV
jgi:RES domain